MASAAEEQSWLLRETINLALEADHRIPPKPKPKPKKNVERMLYYNLTYFNISPFRIKQLEIYSEYNGISIGKNNLSQVMDTIDIF